MKPIEKYVKNLKKKKKKNCKMVSCDFKYMQFVVNQIKHANLLVWSVKVNKGGGNHSCSTLSKWLFIYHFSSVGRKCSCKQNVPTNTHQVIHKHTHENNLKILFGIKNLLNWNKLKICFQIKLFFFLTS